MPISVMRTDGMTGSATNDSVMNGSEPLATPSSAAAASSACCAASTYETGASDMRPAMGSGSLASIRPPRTTT